MLQFKQSPRPFIYAAMVLKPNSTAAQKENPLYNPQTGDWSESLKVVHGEVWRVMALKGLELITKLNMWKHVEVRASSSTACRDKDPLKREEYLYSKTERVVDAVISCFSI